MDSTDQALRRAQRPWWYQPEIAVVTFVVLGIYFLRLTSLPVCGEESRWANGASEMLQTGDWVVPRQQGKVFPERPPMTSWTMAAVGVFRGRIDAVAVRLPSVIAILLTSLLIYAYARLSLSQFGAMAAALAYATFGQVMQIGRLGESEAVFALLVSASLFAWHYGYARSWPPVWMWIAGGSLAGLAALVKGIQGPVYFFGVVVVYLMVQRDWRRLLSWQPWVGVAAFLGVVGMWQVPFVLATDWHAVRDIWTGLARDRLGLGGLASHMVKYPMEILACLLPWSPLLLQFARRPFRKSVGSARSQVVFLVTALAVTCPSVWLAVGARGRYFMPLYPCVAVLIGLAIQRSAESALGTPGRHGWNRYLVVMAALAAIGGILVTGASLIPHERLAAVAQPPAFAVLFALASAITALVLLWACRGVEGRRAQVAVVTMAAFLGLTYTGAVLNAMLAEANDLTPAIAELKQTLAEPNRLVSFGPVSHRFAYYYDTPIEELDWPRTMNDVPDGVTYFCIDDRPGAIGPTRMIGRGRTWREVPRELPFAWEKIAGIGCGRTRSDKPRDTVVVGRIIRPPVATAEVSDREVSRR